MFSNATTAAPILRRQALLGFLLIAAAPLGQAAYASSDSDPTLVIHQFNAALLDAMRAGPQADFSRRFRMLAPAVDEAFDLHAVLAVSIGPNWTTLPADQQTRLLEAFRRYTIASYVANFDNDAGQTFTVTPETRNLGTNRVVVLSRIRPVKGDATELDYVMQQTPSGWKVVDVLAAGSISRVAVQRSDFRHVLSSGGGDALVARLEHKALDLSGGTLA